jgi:hypothetical protein
MVGTWLWRAPCLKGWNTHVHGTAAAAAVMQQLQTCLKPKRVPSAMLCF